MLNLQTELEKRAAMSHMTDKTQHNPANKCYDRPWMKDTQSMFCFALAT